ncbi:YiiX/YebB-like N1pC/P60 family cysteine hydrolase [Labilibacter marinus]|uniref:YiiX/YebB-like N1pC/P60 family cysteine hydrolase n=1 Tax=Labilibacter marinus TaxID=1477105 RepID=UPI00094FF2AB|nr:YiiX/YebB-like N1pC/P60 family cysteine hydrolase [Labilibacter marinus]
MSCTSNNKPSELKNGDILFRGNNNMGLSKAINEVTQTGTNTNYTHMGICCLKGDTMYVIHASAKNGVCMELLTDFQYPDGDSTFITDSYRIKKELQADITEAINIANILIGMPYDKTYILESPGFYCSEFIYHIFKTDSIFTLNPMTFKNPATADFHQGWVEHYSNLGLDIPEGLPGCNPNEMAMEGSLEFIKRL